MKKFIPFLSVILLFPVQVFAQIKIISLLPNPSDWVKNEEIILRNNSCETLNLQGFSLIVDTRDYVFWDQNIAPNEEITIFRSDSRLILKDTGSEIRLKDNQGNEIDFVKYSYEEVEKWKKIYFSYENKNCDNHDSSEKMQKLNENNQKIEENINNSYDENQNNEDEQNENMNKNLVPESIEFIKKSRENFINTIKISYPEELTGAIDLTKISLQEKETNSIFLDVFLWAKIEQNVLILEVEKEKIPFDKINNFILVSEENFWFHSVSGKNIEKFSWIFFENPKNIILTEEPEESIHENENKESVENENNTTLVFHNFPKIVPTFQRTSNVKLEDNILYCQEENCRINFDFSSIFDDQYNEKDFECQLETNDKAYRMCNPPQLLFRNTGEVTFTLIHKPTKTELKTVYFLDFSQIEKINENSEETTKDNENISKPRKRSDNSRKTQTPNYSTPPIIHISSEGKWEKYYQWIDDEHIECFVKECPINLTASGTYSEQDWSLKYYWKFGKDIERNGKNPSTVTLSSGEHTIKLAVVDTNSASAYKEIYVKVPDIDVIREEVNSEKTTKQTKTTPQLLDKSDFSEVELVLQNPNNFTIDEEWNFICVIKTAECSTNFTLTNVVKNMRFFWGWDNEVAFLSKNPGAKKLSPGTHELIIQWYDVNNPHEFLYEKRFVIEVQKEEKITKTKKISTKKQKKTTTKKTQKEPVVTPEKEIINLDVNAQNSEKVGQLETAGWSLMGVLLLMTVFVRIRQKNHLISDEKSI